MHVREAIKRWDDSRNKVESFQVIEDWKRCGVLDPKGNDLYAFKWGYGRLMEKLGQAHNLPLPGNWPIEPVGQDWDLNEVRSTNGAPIWRGNKQQPKQHHDGFRRRDDDDPDRMDPY